MLTLLTNAKIGLLKLKTANGKRKTASYVKNGGKIMITPALGSSCYNNTNAITFFLLICKLLLFFFFLSSSFV